MSRRAKQYYVERKPSEMAQVLYKPATMPDIVEVADTLTNNEWNLYHRAHQWMRILPDFCDRNLQQGDYLLHSLIHLAASHPNKNLASLAEFAKVMSHCDNIQMTMFAYNNWAPIVWAEILRNIETRTQYTHKILSLVVLKLDRFSEGLLRARSFFDGVIEDLKKAS